MKKKNIIFYMLILLSLFLVSCQNKTSTKNYDYDIAIASKGKISTFNFDNGGLKFLEEKTTDSSKGDLFLWYDLYPKGDYYFSKTTYRKTGTSIAKTNKNSLDISYKGNLGRDIFSYCIDENYFYSTSISDKILLSKYKLEDLEFVADNKLSISGVARDIVEKDNYLYVLVYYTDSSGANNSILKINKETLETEEEMEIDKEGYFSRMVLDNNNLYITKLNNFISPSKRDPGNQVLIFNLDTKNKEYIQVENYPSEIYIDKKEQKLIIHYDYNLIRNDKWSIVDIQSKEVIKTLSFEEEFSEKSYGMPFFNQDDGNYYFLFYDSLSIYNKKEQGIKKIDLKQFNIEYAHAILQK